MPAVRAPPTAGLLRHFSLAAWGELQARPARRGSGMMQRMIYLTANPPRPPSTPHYHRLRALLQWPLLVSLAVLGTPPLAAQDHVVSPGELEQHIERSQQTREDHLEQVHSFFSSKRVSKTLRAARVSSAKIEAAVPFLSDEELGRLALQTRTIENDLAAGALTNEQLTYIVIALATAVVVILAT